MKKMTQSEALAIASKGCQMEQKGNVILVKAGSCKGLQVSSALDCLKNHYSMNVIFRAM